MTLGGENDKHYLISYPKFNKFTNKIMISLFPFSDGHDDEFEIYGRIFRVLITM